MFILEVRLHAGRGYKIGTWIKKVNNKPTLFRLYLVG